MALWLFPTFAEVRLSSLAQYHTKHPTRANCCAKETAQHNGTEMRWALWAGGRETESRGLGNMGEPGDVAALETERSEGYSLELAPGRKGSMNRSRADWTIRLTPMISSCPGVSGLP